MNYERGYCRLLLVAIFVKKGVDIRIVPVIVLCRCSEVKVKMDR